MQNKTINVKEVFKPISAEEVNTYLKEKITKLILSQQKIYSKN